MQIGAYDLAIIVVYFVFIVGLGCWCGLRKKKTEQAEEYFLAGKTLKWPVIGLALFATNISTVHLVSLAEAGPVARQIPTVYLGCRRHEDLPAVAEGRAQDVLGAGDVALDGLGRL